MLNKIATVCIATAVLAVCASAQNQGFGRGRGTPPDPQTMIQNRVNHLATLLSLTDAQKASALQIFTNAQAAAAAIQPSVQSNRQALADAVKKNDSATIDSLALTIGNLEGQLTAIHGKAEAAFYALLTPDQKTKYDAMPGRGFGGPGGPMGPAGFRQFRNRPAQQ